MSMSQFLAMTKLTDNGRAISFQCLRKTTTNVDSGKTGEHHEHHDPSIWVILLVLSRCGFISGTSLWHRGAAVCLGVLRHHTVLIRSRGAALTPPAATRPDMGPKSPRSKTKSPAVQQAAHTSPFAALLSPLSTDTTQTLRTDERLRLANSSRFSCRWDYLFLLLHVALATLQPRLQCMRCNGEGGGRRCMHGPSLAPTAPRRESARQPQPGHLLALATSSNTTYS